MRDKQGYGHTVCRKGHSRKLEQARMIHCSGIMMNLVSIGIGALMQQGLELKASILVNGIVRTIGDY